MIRISKITDYGIVLMTHMAGCEQDRIQTARGLAGATHIPQPMVSKILKVLAKAGLLRSHRGVKGGYSLSRPPELISVADMIAALEGPISITECSSYEDLSKCSIELLCPVRTNWQRINSAVLDALREIPLSEMVQPFQRHPASGIAIAAGVGE